MAVHHLHLTNGLAHVQNYKMFLDIRANLKLKQHNGDVLNPFVGKDFSW